MELPRGQLDYLWSRSYGSPDASVKPSDISIDSSNNILLSGTYDGTIDFGDGFLISGTTNIFLAKFNSDATQILWSVGFDDGQSGTTLMPSGSVSDSSGNTYLTGYFRFQTDFGGFSLTPVSGFDMFLVKFDPTGTILWAKKYGSFGNEEPKSIATNSNDEIIVGGQFVGSSNLGGSNLSNNGADDIFLAKFDSNGNHRWSTNFGSSNSDGLLDLYVEGDEIAITGFYKGAGADFGGTPLSFLGFEDIFVAKYRDDGDSISHLFSKGFGSSVSDKGYGVAIDSSNGGVAVTGTFDGSINFGGPTTYPATEGGVDIFLVKLDNNGNWIGDQGFGDSLTFSIVSRDVIIDNQGDVVMAGDMSIPMDFGGGLLSGGSQDVFIAKFNSDLTQHIWSDRYGASIGGDVGRSMILNSGNELLLGGHFWTSINFGGTTHNSEGLDAFIGAFTTD